jgi:hypothetical protein
MINDARGITLLVERLEAANPALVVLLLARLNCSGRDHPVEVVLLFEELVYADPRHRLTLHTRRAANRAQPASVAPQRKTGKGLMLPTARRTQSRLGRRYGVAARRTLWDFLRNVPLRKVATLAYMLAMRREGAHRAGSAAIFH